MAEEIVQKLITLLGWKVDDKGQKQYDQINQRLNNKMVSDNQKANNKRIAQEQKAAEQQKKIAEKVYEFELKVRERLARQNERLAQQKEKRVNQEFERDYKKLLNFEQKEQQVRERALQFEQKVRAKLEQMKEQQAQRDIQRSQKVADLQAKIEENNLKRRLQARERDFERRLQDIQNRNNAREQAQRDKITKGHALQQAGRSIKGAGSTGMQLFGGLIGESVTTAGDIQALLNQVVAHGDFTKTGERQMVAKLSKTISLSSAFNQMEILQGMKELGKAGFKGQTLVDLVQNLPSFATASDSTFAQASKLTTDMMSTFGYKTKEAVKVMDILTTGLNESKLDFSDLSYALKYAAPAWKASGGKLEDLIAVLAIQSQAGIKGSTAGTGNRTAAVNLALGMQDMKKDVNKQKQKQTASSLGLNIYDKQGNFDYLGTLEQLALKTKGYSKAKLTSVLYDLFGKTGMNQAFLVMDTFKDPNKRKAALDIQNKVRFGYSGKTQNVAGIINQGYNFQSKQFENSIINIQEAIGKNFLPTVTEVLNQISKFFNMISENYPILTSLAASFISIGFAVSTLAVVFGSFLIFAGALTVALGVLQISVVSLFFWFLLIPVVIIALGLVFYQFATGGKNAFTDFANSVNTIAQNVFGINIPALFDGLVSFLAAPIETMRSMWSSFINWFATSLPGIANMINQVSGGLINIRPTVNQLVGKGQNFSQTNNQQIHITANGTNSSPAKLGNTIGQSLGVSSKKYWSQMAGAYK